MSRADFRELMRISLQTKPEFDEAIGAALLDGFCRSDFGSFASLLALADEKINTLPFQEVDVSWLRLYVDATIGLSLRHLDQDEILRKPQAGSVLKQLDMAIIVAGGIGPDRADIIQRLISLCQADMSARSGPNRTPPAKRRRIRSSSQLKPSNLPSFAPRPIPELAPPPTFDAYLSVHREQPFILRNYLQDELAWPAVGKWADAEYLLDLVGPGRVVPVEVGKSYTDAGWGQRIIPFEEFLRKIGYPGAAVEAPERSPEILEHPKTGGDVGTADLHGLEPLYLAQHPLLKQFPRLERDISMPDYVYSLPPAPTYMSSYKPPGNEDGLIVNVWVGGGGGSVTSPAHTVSIDHSRRLASWNEQLSLSRLQDPYYNCYAQVLGQKRVWLAPPSVTPHMYAFPEEQSEYENENAEEAKDTLDPAATLSPDGVEAVTGLATSYTSNTSSVPIFEQANEALRAKYPAFYQSGLPESMETVLGPGDMLVMPPGWWHAMRGEGDGVAWSVSMWY